MFNDMNIGKRGNEDKCTPTFKEIKQYTSRFVKGHWALLDQDAMQSGFCGSITSQMENEIPLLQKWSESLLKKQDIMCSREESH